LSSFNLFKLVFQFYTKFRGLGTVTD